MLPFLILSRYTEIHKSISFCSKTFVDTLKRVGAWAELILYGGKTHTDLSM